MGEQPEKLSRAAIVSLMALALLGLIGGWLILLSGGFYHQLTRYSPEATWVGGSGAWLMAGIDFLMTALGVAALLQMQRLGRVWYFVGCGAVILPPCLFVLVNQSGQ